MSSKFRQRFAAFEPISSPPLLNYHDYLRSITSGSNPLANNNEFLSLEQFNIDVISVLEATSLCFQNARKFVDEVKKLSILRGSVVASTTVGKVGGKELYSPVSSKLVVMGGGVGGGVGGGNTNVISDMSVHRNEFEGIKPLNVADRLAMDSVVTMTKVRYIKYS